MKIPLFPYLRTIASQMWTIILMWVLLAGVFVYLANVLAATMEKH